MIQPILITAPTKEPISLAEAKLQCRVDSTIDDDLFDIYIASARIHFEERTGRTVHDTTWEYVLDDWPAGNAIILPRATPLLSITSLKYKDSGGVETTWAASNYIADTDSLPGRVVLTYGNSWPSFTKYPVSPIRIRYQAGIAASPITEASQDIKYVITLLVGGMYENRESIRIESPNVAQIAVQYGVEAFIAKNIVSYVF